MRCLSARLLAASTVLLLCACGARGTFRDGAFHGQEAVYRVSPLEAPWARVSLSGNDLAWAGPAGAVVAVNGLCTGHGDPSLKVLTDHLLMGFDAREILGREELMLAGRAALRTRAAARLDGIPMEMELTVLKKDGCVYDLSYSAPPSSFETGLGAYRAVVESFEAMGARR